MSNIHRHQDLLKGVPLHIGEYMLGENGTSSRLKVTRDSTRYNANEAVTRLLANTSHQLEVDSTSRQALGQEMTTMQDGDRILMRRGNAFVYEGGVLSDVSFPGNFAQALDGRVVRREGIEESALAELLERKKLMDALTAGIRNLEVPDTVCVGEGEIYTYDGERLQRQGQAANYVQFDNQRPVFIAEPIEDRLPALLVALQKKPLQRRLLLHLQTLGPDEVVSVGSDRYRFDRESGKLESVGFSGNYARFRGTSITFRDGISEEQLAQILAALENEFSAAIDFLELQGIDTVRSTNGTTYEYSDGIVRIGGEPGRNIILDGNKIEAVNGFSRTDIKDFVEAVQNRASSIPPTP